MSKTVTLRLEDEVYDRLRAHATRDNRPLSNLIETAALRYLETEEHVDEFEMEEIRANKTLNESLTRAHQDAKARRGRFA